MTVDEPTVAPPSDPEPLGEAPVPTGPQRPRTTQQQALDTYKGRLRVWRRVYAAALTLIVIVVAVAVRIAWTHGEIAHTTLHTVALPPPSLSLQPPPSTEPILGWRSADHTAIGIPYWGGTLVTWSQHTVRGRNLVNGAPTWSYTRTDRDLCTAIQVQGTTIALFKFNGDCDELTALDTQTGKRKWTRTLFKDGQHVTGNPSYFVSPYTVLITSTQVVYAVDPGGGLDRWTFGHPGCTIHSAVLGSQGALISQTCAHEDCTNVKFCMDGDQLLLRNGTDAGGSDADKAKQNPDLVMWNIASKGIPVSADQVVSATDTNADSLTVFDPVKGTVLTTLTLTGQPSIAGISQLATARGELIWIGGVSYLVVQSGTRYLWKVPTAGPPTATPLPGGVTAPVDLEQAVVLAPTTSGVDLLNGATGKVTRVYAVGGAPAGSQPYQYGSGFVVAGPSTVVYQ